MSLIRSQLTFTILSTILLGLPTQMRHQFAELGQEFANALSAKDSLHQDPLERATFWASLWHDLNEAETTAEVIPAVETAHALAKKDFVSLQKHKPAPTGVKREPVAGDASTVAVVAQEVGDESHRDDEDMGVDIGSSEMLISSAAHNRSPGTPSSAGTLDKVAEVMFCKHAAAALCSSMISLQNAGGPENLLFYNAEDASDISVVVQTVTNDMHLPFWGKVCYGTKQAKHHQHKLWLGQLHGA